MTIPRRPGRAALVTTVLLATSCLGSGPELPSGPPFGDDDIVYLLMPQRIGYYYRDTSKTGNVQHDITLRWLSDSAFTGFNCIGFLPRSPSDTIGTFRFYSEGPNQGLLEQTSGTVIDTVVGLLLTGREGTRGTYAVNSSNQLTLFWSDGEAHTRFFDPSAVMTFTGDTLRSVADLSFKADSVRAQWDVSWVRDPCGR